MGQGANEVPAEAHECGFIDIEGMRLWKAVTVVGSGDDRWLAHPSKHFWVLQTFERKCLAKVKK